MKTQPFEKRGCCPVEHGLSRPRVASNFVDIASLLKRAHDAINVHTANRGDLVTGHRLLVGDNCKRL